MQDRTYAVDFETFYDKEYSLREMSMWNYVFNDSFDAYLVAVHGDDLHWVGHPKDFDWNLLGGCTLVMHNASFDGLVIKKLQETGIIPAGLDLTNLVDTADLAVWLSAPRALKHAAKQLLGIDMEKAVRDQMKGKTYNDMVSAGGEEALLKYGGDDALYTYMIWDKYSDQWPEKERIASRINREAGWYGLAVDAKLVDTGLVTLKQKLFEVERNIPWINDGEKPLSPKAIRMQGRKEGIPVPASLAKSNPAVLAWQREYADKHPWIMATSDYRSVNMHLGRVQAIKDNIRADGTMPYSCKYFGASTGRFSGGGDGGGKFNMLNMPRQAMFGVDVRPMFVARPGHKLIIADYAQIEARMLLWRVGDVDFMNILAEEGNLYQAYAKKVGFYKGTGSFKKEDPDGYQYIKASVLGLGYGCGDARFREMAETSYGVVLSAADAKKAVVEFREKNPLICTHWWGHQVHLKLSANARDKTHEVALKSGRDLVYFDPQFTGDREVKVRFEMGGNLRKVYGGLLTENEIQATARDVLVDAMVGLDKSGYRYLLSVYDEIVVEVPESEAADAAKEVEHIMTSSSPWAEGCLLEVEYEISDHYKK